MRVRFTATAFVELNEIRNYIARDKFYGRKGRRFRVEQVIGRIAQFPLIAREIDPSGVRVFPVGPFPYLIFYTVEDEEVIIRNVRHGKRRPPGEA
jgi:plasmid stabilization system protein ParE